MDIDIGYLRLSLGYVWVMFRLCLGYLGLSLGYVSVMLSYL